MPAKDATVPNLVPRKRLEAANQLSLVVTYGSAPVAALLFSGLTLASGVLDGFWKPPRGQPDLPRAVRRTPSPSWCPRW